MGRACPLPKVSTGATKSWFTVAPGATSAEAVSSSTSPLPAAPGGTLTAAVPWLVTLIRV